MSTSIPIHQRNYETEAFAEEDGTMRLVGRLVDTKPHGLALSDGEPIVIHDMTVELIVHGETFEILDVRPDMNVHPYDQCRAILESYDQLVGISIARGYSRKVKELFGGPNGCSHVGALLIALGPVAIQASWSLATLHDDLSTRLEVEVDEAKNERHLNLNENTCHVWRTDGSQMVKLRSGTRPDRPAWETERLAKLGVIDPN